jgi:hypothetical protein
VAPAVAVWAVAPAVVASAVAPAVAVSAVAPAVAVSAVAPAAAASLLHVPGSGRARGHRAAHPGGERTRGKAGLPA